MVQSEIEGYYIPISNWNLNELFSSESISPFSFYANRDYGNPISREYEKKESDNYLILFSEIIQSEILLFVKKEAVDNDFIFILSGKNVLKNKVYGYSKTIYLKRDNFKLYFSSEKKRNLYRLSAFMLLEVKTLSKYDELDSKNLEILSTLTTTSKRNIPSLQLYLRSRDVNQTFFDRAYNQIKGLIYGYVVSSIGSLTLQEQTYLNDLNYLKNSVGGLNTDLSLAKSYTSEWQVSIYLEVDKCKLSYQKLFPKTATVYFDNLKLRLKEVDSLFRMKCDEIKKQNSNEYKFSYSKLINELEKSKHDLFIYESESDIYQLRNELASIKAREKFRGKESGKSRLYFKDGSEEYFQKKELKLKIAEWETSEVYIEIKNKILNLELNLQKFSFGYTPFDSSIDDQFSRINDYINELIKRANSFFINSQNKSFVLPDLKGFHFNLVKLSEYYMNNSNSYSDFIISIPDSFSKNLSLTELMLLKISINSIFCYPQGFVGNISEEKTLNIIKMIGSQLNVDVCKNDQDMLRQYYFYRTHKSDTFEFPKIGILRNILVLFMKISGHDQINKMLAQRGIDKKEISFMLWGAYQGFTNLPKTFTNILFESGNDSLINYIDEYLFNTYLK